MKKYLIITLTAGNGHNSVANAVKDEIIKKDESTSVKIIDLFNYFNKKMKAYIVNEGYLAVCKAFLKSYNLFFKLGEKHKPESRYSSPALKFVFDEIAPLYKEIANFSPDAIICTHFYTSTAISNARLAYKLDVPIFTIITDFGVSPYWECSTLVDYIISPTEELLDKIMYKGYKREQILPFGIPTNPKFAVQLDKIEMKKQLGLSENKLSILIMAGNFGVSSSKAYISAIEKVADNFEIVVINGNSKQSYKTTEKLVKKYKQKFKIINIGFSKEVDKYMSACDAIIMKAGGITTCEALNKHIPIIIPCKLARQEWYNKEYLVKNGAGIYAPTNKLLKDAIRYITTGNNLKDMQQNQQKIAKPNATKDFVDFIFNLKSDEEKSKFSDVSKESNHHIKSTLKKAIRTIKRKQK